MYYQLTNKVYSAVASGTYQWIEAKRPFLDRHRTTTFNAVYTGGATLGYMEYNDGTTSTYYSGPVTTAAIGTKILTKYTSEVTAKANRVRLDLLGVSRIDLPNLQEARTIRIYFSNYLGNLAVYEYYPRRLVQTDDLEAETITSINIAAGGVNADRITAITLSAIQANIGALVINTTGSIWQGTGTATSPTTGLKIYNSGGIGKLSTYNAGTEQITLDTDGVLKAGAGKVTLNADGIITISDTSAEWTTGGYKLSRASGLNYGAITGTGGNFGAAVYMGVWTASTQTYVSNIAFTYVSSGSGLPTSNYRIVLTAGSGTAVITLRDGNIDLSTTDVNITGTLSITSTLAVTGATTMTGLATLNGGLTVNDAPTIIITDAITVAASNVLGLRHRSTGTPGVGFGADINIYLDSATVADRTGLTIRTIWATATDASRKSRTNFFTWDTTNRTALTLEASGTAAMIGFLGAGAVVRQNITGVLTAATLAQLTTVVSNILTGLTNLGLTTNSTT